MALTATLFRFRIELSDIDRGVYESLDFRVAMHPSEALPYLLTRVLAFALNAQPGLEFTPGGLSDPDAPALRTQNSHGGTGLWIEIGNPSARKLHKASKAADAVKVYTYKDPEALVREIEAGDVHRADAIEIHSFASSFLDRLSGLIEKDNRWTLVHNEGILSLTHGSVTEEGEVLRHSLHFGRNP